MRVQLDDGDPLYFASWYRASFGVPGVASLSAVRREGEDVLVDATVILEASMPKALSEQAQGVGWLVAGFDSAYRTVEVVMQGRQPTVRMRSIPAALNDSLSVSASQATVQSVPALGPGERRDAWVGLAIDGNTDLNIWWRLTGDHL